MKNSLFFSFKILFVHCSAKPSGSQLDETEVQADVLRQKK